MRNTYLTVGIIVVILIIIAFAVVRSRLPQIGQGRTTPTPTAIQAAQETMKPSLTVSKHTPASSVVIDSVTLTNAGFVVIHASQNNQPGEVLGVSDLLAPGIYTNVPIKLSRKTTEGETLIAIVHSDNGDGKFEEQNDQATKQEDGSPLQTQILVETDSTNGFQTPATGLGEDE